MKNPIKLIIGGLAGLYAAGQVIRLMILLSTNASHAGNPQQQAFENGNIFGSVVGLILGIAICLWMMRVVFRSPKTLSQKVKDEGWPLVESDRPSTYHTTPSHKNSAHTSVIQNVDLLIGLVAGVAAASLAICLIFQGGAIPPENTVRLVMGLVTSTTTCVLMLRRAFRNSLGRSGKIILGATFLGLGLIGIIVLGFLVSSMNEHAANKQGWTETKLTDMGVAISAPAPMNVKQTFDSTAQTDEQTAVCMFGDFTYRMKVRMINRSLKGPDGHPVAGFADDLEHSFQRIRTELPDQYGFTFSTPTEVRFGELLAKEIVARNKTYYVVFRILFDDNRCCKLSVTSTSAISNESPEVVAFFNSLKLAPAEASVASPSKTSPSKTSPTDFILHRKSKEQEKVPSEKLPAGWTRFMLDELNFSVGAPNSFSVEKKSFSGDASDQCVVFRCQSGSVKYYILLTEMGSLSSESYYMCLRAILPKDAVEMTRVHQIPKGTMPMIANFPSEEWEYTDSEKKSCYVYRVAKGLPFSTGTAALIVEATDHITSTSPNVAAFFESFQMEPIRKKGNP